MTQVSLPIAMGFRPRVAGGVRRLPDRRKAVTMFTHSLENLEIATKKIIFKGEDSRPLVKAGLDLAAFYHEIGNFRLRDAVLAAIEDQARVFSVGGNLIFELVECYRQLDLKDRRDKLIAEIEKEIEALTPAESEKIFPSKLRMVKLYLFCAQENPPAAAQAQKLIDSIQEKEPWPARTKVDGLIEMAQYFNQSGQPCLRDQCLRRAEELRILLPHLEYKLSTGFELAKTFHDAGSFACRDQIIAELEVMTGAFRSGSDKSNYCLGMARLYLHMAKSGEPASLQKAEAYLGGELSGAYHGFPQAMGYFELAKFYLERGERDKWRETAAKSQDALEKIAKDHEAMCVTEQEECFKALYDLYLLRAAADDDTGSLFAAVKPSFYDYQFDHAELLRHIKIARFFMREGVLTRGAVNAADSPHLLIALGRFLPDNNGAANLDQASRFLLDFSGQPPEAKHASALKGELPPVCSEYVVPSLLPPSPIAGSVFVPALLDESDVNLTLLKEAADKGLVFPAVSNRVLAALLAQRGFNPETVFFVPMRSPRQKTEPTIHGRSIHSDGTPSFVFKGVGSPQIFSHDGLATNFDHSRGRFYGGTTKLALDLSPYRKMHAAFDELMAGSPIIAKLASFFHVRRDLFYAPSVNFIPLGLPVVNFPATPENLLSLAAAERITLARPGGTRVIEREAGFGLLGIHRLEEGFPLSDMRVQLYKTAVPHRTNDFVRFTNDPKTGRNDHRVMDYTHEAQQKLKSFFRYYGMELEIKGAIFNGDNIEVKVGSAKVSTQEALEFILSALALRLGISQHVIHDKLERCGSQDCGSCFEPHNTNFLSIFDYDTVLLGDVSADKIGHDLYWANETIRLFESYFRIKADSFVNVAGFLDFARSALSQSTKTGRFNFSQSELLSFLAKQFTLPLPAAAWDDGREYVGFAA